MKKSISFLDNFSVPESLLSRLSEVSGNGFKGELKSFENTSVK